MWYILLKNHFSSYYTHLSYKNLIILLKGWSSFASGASKFASVATEKVRFYNLDEKKVLH